MAKFRTGISEAAKPESPALLFRDLKRDPSIKFLWDHQAKLLESYAGQHLKTDNVALELPTGSGKTLVALLISEYRRRAFNERVVFLCPTRQLCGQVLGQARKYGVTAALLTGPQKDYDVHAFLSYQQAKAVAITTYSGIFNVNPRIDDPHFVICDDAHAADQYVASLWTVEIDRLDHKDAFTALYRVLSPVLPEGAIHNVEAYGTGRKSNQDVELVSTIAAFAHFGAIRDALDAQAKGADWGWAWSVIRDHLDACAIYSSATSFEIRPIIPPTMTHAPFAGAKQRLYMSATLGEDGDLERCFGVKRISTLPIPEGWDTRGTGRRLILFPNIGNRDGSVTEAVVKLFEQVPRGLFLAPDGKSREVAEKIFSPRFAVMGPSDVEQDMTRFTAHPGPVVLLIANRWEGIDLPGEHCRMMALMNLPVGASLQERYVLNRLGAVSQLRDRIRTRVTQAIGRCTRDEGDFAVVLMIGNDLAKFCCTHSNIAGMHPELQAEIAFGLENSTDRSQVDFVELTKEFLGQTENWAEANRTIVERRKAMVRQPDEAAHALRGAVVSEIEYVYRLWNGEYDSAALAAHDVLARLSGGKELRPYRSLWYHQAAVAAYLAFQTTKDEKFRAIAIDGLEKASTTSHGIRWLGTLRAQLTGTVAGPATEDLPLRQWFVEINGLLTAWGIRGIKYQQMVAESHGNIEATDDGKRFERGLASLGAMLGARTHSWSEDGAPDGLWVFGDWHAFVFEAKTEEAPGEVSLKTVRQAATHEERVRADKLIPNFVGCTTVVVSRHERLAKLAVAHANEIRHVTQAQIVALFERAAKSLELVRMMAPTSNDEVMQAEAEEIYKRNAAFMLDVRGLLEAKRLLDLKHP